MVSLSVIHRLRLFLDLAEEDCVISGSGFGPDSHINVQGLGNKLMSILTTPLSHHIPIISPIFLCFMIDTQSIHFFLIVFIELILKTLQILQ